MKWSELKEEIPYAQKLSNVTLLKNSLQFPLDPPLVGGLTPLTPPVMTAYKDHALPLQIVHIYNTYVKPP